MRQFAGEHFVKLEDVHDPITVRISAVRPGKFGKPNLYLENGSVLGLNSTNVKMLIEAYGPNGQDWVGQLISLYVGEVKFNGQMQPAVLVKPVSAPLKFSERTPLPASSANGNGNAGEADLDEALPYQ
jgi:hypothetical protein